MMRNKVLFSSLIMLFGCTQSAKNEDGHSQILTADFAEHKNFMPLETLDLSSEGIKDKIHVIYVCFDPGVDGKAFPQNEDVDHFSFKIEQDGAYRPTFKKSALKISRDYEEYFKTIEEIFWKYDGRPHYGKMNTMKKDQFANTYANWNKFSEIQKNCDPNGIMLNEYLKSIL